MEGGNTDILSRDDKAVLMSENREECCSTNCPATTGSFLFDYLDSARQCKTAQRNWSEVKLLSLWNLSGMSSFYSTVTEM